MFRVRFWAGAGGRIPGIILKVEAGVGEREVPMDRRLVLVENRKVHFFRGKALQEDPQTVEKVPGTEVEVNGFTFLQKNW